jgi:DNA repair protein SbcC/Rad50
VKPLVLTMQAFGPFAERERVDFTLLGERALFLIHGPTGAGKTTLLDAICFALYGDTSGGEREARAMRSDHARQDLATEVALEFSLGPERYRVTRSPAQPRPKKRGEGMVEAKPEAQLDRLVGGGWKSVASQPQKASDAVRELLGFDSAQFRQVIVLPQGRFRELLVARSDEREAILQTLFRTEICRALADELKRRARALEEAGRDNRTRRDELLRHAGHETLEALTVHRAELVAEHARLQAGEAAARERDAAARAALDQGRNVAQVLRERDEALQAERALGEAVPAIDAQRRELDAAQRAAALCALEDVRTQVARAAEEAGKRHRERIAQLDAATRAHDDAAARLAIETARAPERETLMGRQRELEALAKPVAELVGAQSRHAAALQRQVAAQAVTAQAEQALAAQHERVQKHRAEREQFATLAARIEALEHRLREVNTARERQERLDQARKALVQSEVELQRAVGAVTKAEAAQRDAQHRLEAVEHAWVAAQAGRLAAALEAGVPCPVCGSTDHPQPAVLADDVSETALRGARDAVRATAAARDAVLTQRHAADKLAGQQRAVVEELQRGAPTAQDALPDPAALQADLLTARTAARRLAELDHAVPQIEQALSDLDAGLAQRRLELGAAERELTEAAADLRVLQQAVPEDLREPARLQAETDRVVMQRKALESALMQVTDSAKSAENALAAARATEQGAQAELGRMRMDGEAAQARFAAALEQAGFADEAAWRAVWRGPDAMERMAVVIRAHDESRAAISARLVRAQTAAEGLHPPDLDALQHAAAEAARALEAALLAIRDAVGRVETADRTLEAIADLAEAAGEVERQYAVLGRLAEVAAGNNPLRMTFQRFVLATLLDEVLEAASLRLTRMSRNRFELHRVRGVTDLRSAGGLDLEIFDHHTGTSRPAATLSGGEGFLASLSLALGLADVVQSRSGGIRMETLFIDEGFGTLDPESLDFALRTLIDLQQTGRLVGVISHVAELRERWMCGWRCWPARPAAG